MKNINFTMWTAIVVVFCSFFSIFNFAFGEPSNKDAACWAFNACCWASMYLIEKYISNKSENKNVVESTQETIENKPAKKRRSKKNNTDLTI